MRFHKKSRILSILCCFLISACSIPVFAEDTADDVQTYYTRSGGIIEAYIYTDMSWQQLNEDNDIGGTALYTEDDTEWLYFLINWNEEEFNGGIASGQQEFIVHGVCVPDLDDWSQYDVERWQAEKIKVSDASIQLRVHVRPQDYVAEYKNTDEPATRKVRSCTSFEEVSFYDSAYLETESPYDPQKCLFHIEWSKEEYMEGIRSGKAAFTMHGNYTACEDPEMRELLDAGLIRADGTEVLTIEVEQEPTSPRVYYDPYAWTEELHTSVSPDTPFEELDLPASSDLELLGKDYDYADVKTFSIRWNKKEYEEGIASGAKKFSISGEYTSDNLDQIEKEWWNKGLITIEGGRAVVGAIITVAEEGTDIPLSVSLHLEYEKEIYPKFKFANPGNVSKVICAVSTDGVNWEEFDATGYVENNFANYQIPAYIYDENDQLISIPDNGPSYYKMIIEGGPYAGESAVITRNPPHDLTDEDDDISGDRGGGGQGEHDRPDKDEPLPPVEPPVQPPVEPPEFPPSPVIPVRPPAVLPPELVAGPAEETSDSLLLGDASHSAAGHEPQSAGTAIEPAAPGLVAAVSRDMPALPFSKKRKDGSGGETISEKSDPGENGNSRKPAFIWGLTGTAALMTAGSLLALRRRRLNLK